MKKSTVVSVIVFVIGLGFIGGISHAAEKVVTLEMSSFMPATEKKQMMLQEFADEVGKRTSGRIKINMHPGATLTPPTQTFDSVEKEIIDLGFGPLGATGGMEGLLTHTLQAIMVFYLPCLTDAATTKYFNKQVLIIPPRDNRVCTFQMSDCRC